METTPSDLTVRALQAQDDRSTFCSGNVELDRFFQRYAGQNQFRHHIGTTYVAVDPSGTIHGFVTVAMSELTTAALPERARRSLPRYPLPVLRVARLAVSISSRGRGVGHLLLRASFALAHRLATDVGCLGVVVDAKPEAVAFYERLGFEALEATAGDLGDRPQPVPMFLELEAIA